MLLKTKNDKSKDYCKADLKQRLFFFYNIISAGHISLLQVYRCIENCFPYGFCWQVMAT